MFTCHEFYVVRLYSQEDFENNKDILLERVKESLKARQKNKLITKRKNFSKKQLKEEYLNDLQKNHAKKTYSLH